MNTGRTPRFVIVDENFMLDPEVQEFIQQFRQAIKDGHVITIDSCSMLEERMMIPDCTFEEPDNRLHNWKDFIQNPARPGRQIKKQRAPKQSFRAQMRSVNRNR